jgi:hypothetical protein
MFDNFGELRERILSETEKSANAAFDKEIPGFVTLAETRMWYGSGELGDPLYSPSVRIRAMETSTAALAFTTGAGSLAGLTSFLDKRNLYWPSTPIAEPNYEPPAVFWPQRENANGATRPVAYTIEGNAIYVRPALTGNATLLYFAKLTALADNTDTNWILQNMPAAYFYGTLIEAYRWLRNEAKIVESFTGYRAAVSALNGTEARARFSGGRMVRRATW